MMMMMNKRMMINVERARRESARARNHDQENNTNKQKI